MEMSGALTKVMPRQGIGFALYRQKRAVKWSEENSSGFTNEQSMQGGTLSGDLLDQM